MRLGTSQTPGVVDAKPEVVELPSPGPSIGERIRRRVGPFYDRLERAYESERAQRVIGTLIVTAFLGGIGYAELVRRDILSGPEDLTHFVAVEIAFTLLLVVEVVGLVMGIVGSVSNAMGKQVEILSLILLRDAFKEFSHFGEPIEWARVEPVLPQILADIGGGILLFVLLGLYYRVQLHMPITRDTTAQESFIGVKKLVALLMIGVFVLIGAADLGRGAIGLPYYPFFETFYTVLIFADVLVVLISLRYSTTYAVVFRNSGFTLTTVIIRLTLTAPPLVRPALGVGAGLLALGLSAAYRFFPRHEPDDAASEP